MSSPLSNPILSTPHALTSWRAPPNNSPKYEFQWVCGGLTFVPNTVGPLGPLVRPHPPPILRRVSPVGRKPREPRSWSQAAPCKETLLGAERPYSPSLLVGAESAAGRDESNMAMTNAKRKSLVGQVCGESEGVVGRNGSFHC